MEKDIYQIRITAERIASLMEILVNQQLEKHACCRAVNLPTADTTHDAIALLREIAANTKSLAQPSLLTNRKIYKAEAIKLLNISERSYGRHKANGLLIPRGLGHDFYYPEDLERAMEEGRRRGRL